MTRTHEIAYSVPSIFKDGASRCECGWVSRVSTPARANAAHTRHANHEAEKQTPEWKNRPRTTSI